MENLFSCAMDIGEQMLISGAEVHRVEESISRICYALGAKRVDVFIITSSMVVTVLDENGNTYTQTRRITSTSTDFEKLHRLNKLSRKICEKRLTEEEIISEFEWVQTRKTYPFWLECIAYAVIAGAFTIFFGGNVTEMAVSICVGAIVRFGILLCDNTVKNKIFSKFFSAAMATFLAYISVKGGIIGSVDKVIIGNIMSLIPGIGLTNALRDLITGDTMAGILHLIDGVLIATCLVLGFVLADSV